MTIAARVLAVVALLGIATQVRAQDTVRAIVVERGNVFDANEARFPGFRLVNLLHVRTRERVVRRELLFTTGAPWDTARVNESVRNLRGLGVFQEVRIDSARTDSGLVARVRTVDAWTTTPGFDLTTSGSQRVLSFSLAESNLFGTRTFAAVSYVDDPDRSSVSLSLDSPRLIADRVSVGATIVERSDGHVVAAGVRAPFVSLSTRTGGGATFQRVDTRVLRFVGGDPVAAAELRLDRTQLRADAAWALEAGSHGYTRVGVATTVGHNDYRPDGTPRGPRTTEAAFAASLAFRRPRFVEVRNVARMGQVEDVDLGLSASGALSVAPAALGAAQNVGGVSAAVATGARVPGGFARVGATAAAYRSSGVDSGWVRGAATVVMQRGTRHLLVAHASAGALQNPAPGNDFDLGLDAGLRAFPAHAYTGDRLLLLSAEYRVIVLPRVFGLVGVGAAAFVDHGAAWFHGDPRRGGTEQGVGLRIGSLREAGASVLRMDISYRSPTDRLAGGLVTTIGRGFVFGGI